MANSQYVHPSTLQSHSPTNFEHIIWGEISVQLDNAVLGMSCHVTLREGEGGGSEYSWKRIIRTKCFITRGECKGRWYLSIYVYVIWNLTKLNGVNAILRKWCMSALDYFRSSLLYMIDGACVVRALESTLAAVCFPAVRFAASPQRGSFCALTWSRFCHGHAAPSRECPYLLSSTMPGASSGELQASMESPLWRGPRRCHRVRSSGDP